MDRYAKLVAAQRIRDDWGVDRPQERVNNANKVVAGVRFSTRASTLPVSPRQFTSPQDFDKHGGWR
jgi:hypothetical protein